MARRKYVPHAGDKPSQVNGSPVWRGQFGEAVVRTGISAPEKRTLQADMWWLLDNVLKVGECLDVNRNFEQVRVQVSRYIKERGVKRGVIKVRAIEKGTRVWKLDSGYERPD